MRVCTRAPACMREYVCVCLYSCVYILLTYTCSCPLTKQSFRTVSTFSYELCTPRHFPDLPKKGMSLKTYYCCLTERIISIMEFRSRSINLVGHVKFVSNKSATHQLCLFILVLQIYKPILCITTVIKPTLQKLTPYRQWHTQSEWSKLLIKT